MGDITWLLLTWNVANVPTIKKGVFSAHNQERNIALSTKKSQLELFIPEVFLKIQFLLEMTCVIIFTFLA